MSHPLKTLLEMSDEQLVMRHDTFARDTILDTQYYLDEIRRREQVKTNKTMERLTKWMFALTVVVTIATLVNVAVYIADKLGHLPTA